MTEETVLTHRQIGEIAISVHIRNETQDFNQEFSRAIEQAVLNSPEVQAWKRDAERYRWLRDPCSGAERVVFYSRGDYGKGLDSGPTLDANIDAAMEKKT